MTRQDAIWELDRREKARNEPNRRGLLSRCRESLFYCRPPHNRAGIIPSEPTDAELRSALAAWRD